MILASVWALFFGSGCATLAGSVAIGTGSGVAVGATVGAVAASEDRVLGAVVGSLIGAGVGALSSLLIHKGVESRDANIRKETLFNLEKFGVSGVPRMGSSVPAISFGVVDEQKIETHRQGNKVVEGHRIWILSDDSSIQYSEADKQKK